MKPRLDPTAGWILDKSAASRVGDPAVSAELRELSGRLFICPMGRLEQLYSARGAADYDRVVVQLRDELVAVTPPADVLERALTLQHDLAHHHGMWHRVPIPDLVIAETALHHGLGVVHVDGDYDKIAEVRPLTSRRLSTK